MTAVARTVMTCKAILMRSELKEGMEQLLCIFKIPNSKLHEVIRAATKEFSHYADCPEFNGMALVFKAMMIDGVLTIRSTPLLSAYRDSIAPAAWSTFYTDTDQRNAA